MHETRNLIVVLLLIAAAVWAILVWFVMAPPLGEASSTLMVQRWLTVILVLALGGATFYVLNIEDKMPDRLAARVGSVYYDVDGLSFMPTVRVDEHGQAELSLYYQNRFENYCTAVVHLRPSDDSFKVREGVHDLHFAFKADGGDFGVIHQPIGVPRHLQGDVVRCQLAAAVRFPRSHGTRLCSHEGLSCGSFAVDWGQAFKIGVHEVSTEIELKNPCPVHLSMPMNVNEEIRGRDTWRQETINPGPSEVAVLG